MRSADRLRPCGDTVLERVLLAIIEAHTTPETEGRQRHRLDAAVAALLGPVTRRERDFERALRFISHERHRDACDVEMTALAMPCAAVAISARSIRQLAEVAAREVMGCTAPDEVCSTARLLCDLYRTRGTAHAIGRDPVTDALEAEAVQRLCAELAEWGVPTRL